MDSPDGHYFHHLSFTNGADHEEDRSEYLKLIADLDKIHVGVDKLLDAKELRSSGRKWLNCLKSLLLCLTTLVDEPSRIPPDLLSRIEDAIAKIPGVSDPGETSLLNNFYYGSLGQNRVMKDAVEDAVANIPSMPSWSDVYSMGKEVDLCFTNILPADEDEVGRNRDCNRDRNRTTCCLLKIALDFLQAAQINLNPFREFRSAEVEVIDGFEVQISFLKNLLLFTEKAGVKPDQLRDVLLRVQPLAINAARVFTTYGVDHKDSFEQVRSMCSAVNRQAADPQLYQAYSQVLKTLNLSSGRAPVDDGGGGDDTLDVFKKFVGSLISLLWGKLCAGEHPLEKYTRLYDRLRFLRSFLRQMGEKFDVKLREQTGAMICDAGVSIFSVYRMNADDPMLSELLARFDAFENNVASQTSESSSSKADELDSDANEKEEAEAEAAIQTTPGPLAADFGDDEVVPVLERLIRGSRELRMVPISGMAGIGKTTFALKLYNHPSVMYHFHSRVRCTISQVMDKKKVLSSLLSQSEPGKYLGMTEDDLANKLRQSLKGKRYLILLDDVWTPDVMDSLRDSFPDDSTCSRIILTSRYRDITPGIHDQQPHLLRLRKDSECLEMLRIKLSDKQGWTLEHGMQIAKLCKGLPMTVVIIAGLLVTTGNQDWKGIMESLSSDSVSSEEQCKSAMEMSYKHMPDYLQPCFLYFGAFPEDEEVSVWKMSTLWIAEGFVGGNESKTGQDVAREYLDKLIERSLVTVSKKRSIGGVRTFQIHDLLRDFCRAKSKEENLLHLLQQRYDQLSNFNEPSGMLRLSIHSDLFHLKKSGLFCPRARSMLLFSPQNHCSFYDMVFILQIFKLLQVLHMDGIRLDNAIPDEIQLLTELRYLSIYSSVAIIPSSVGKLSKLETFIADFEAKEVVSFPDTLWDLQELTCLHIECSAYGFTLPIMNIENCPSLLKLETLCGVVFSSDDSMEKQMRKFPNMRRLKCIITLPGVESLQVLESLCHLESLTMLARRGKHQCEFGSVQNLRKMTLESFELSREDIAVIGNLPCLEVLKFGHISFEDGELEMEEGEFSNLRFFKLYDWGGNLKRWTASDDQLPCLKKLVLRWCKNLTEIPSDCLENSTTLEEIEVDNCSAAVEASVTDIEKTQSDYGYSIKVHMIQHQQS